MSDRIVILHNGKIEQVGTPAEIYDDPETAYVASFVGSANILHGGVVQVTDDGVVLKNEFGTMNGRYRNSVGAGAESSEVGKDGVSRQVCVGDHLTLAIRSENIGIARKPETDTYIEGTITEKSFAGGMLRIAVQMADGSEIVISRHGINIDYAIGEHVYMEWSSEAAVLVDMEANR